MGEIRNVLGVAAATLIAFLLLTRIVAAFRSGRPDAEHLLSIAFLLALGTRLFAGVAATLAVVWALERLLRLEERRGDRRSWDAMLAGSLCVLLLFHAIGYGSLLPFRLFSAFLTGLFGLFPLRRLFLRTTRGSRRMAVVSAAAAVLWVSVAVLSWACGIDLHPLAVFGAACAAGMEALPAARDRDGGDSLLASLHARFLGVERTMERQDRLIAAGIVAAGAVHEFKNALSLLELTAEHGLAAKEIASKDRDLTLILEQARSAGGTAVVQLERISREGREPVRQEDVAEALRPVLSLLRAAFRAEGVVIRAEVPGGIRVLCRIGEMEQILLNLVRNAVEAYRARSGVNGVRTVAIAARLDAGEGPEARVLLDVRDEAGGVPPEMAANLFRLPDSSKGSTGIGLYLARELAVRNDGMLDYIPIPGGSCFRLILPAAGAAP